MRLLSFLFIQVFFLYSCGHHKKNPGPPPYTPKVGFEHEQKTFEALVGLPKDFKDKIPLVIIVHEWWGRTPYIMDRARMLNEQGYATLPVDLYGDNLTVETPSEAQALATPFYEKPELGISRLKQYLDQASQDPHIDPKKIFVIGYCFGGTQALNLARSGADIKGVVSFHGGLTTSYKTQDIKSRVLVLNGAADPMVPKKDVAAFRTEMDQHKADYKVINYSASKHAFTNPRATEIGKKFNLPIAYNAKADQASWMELLKFLQD